MEEKSVLKIVKKPICSKKKVHFALFCKIYTLI